MRPARRPALTPTLTIVIFLAAGPAAASDAAIVPPPPAADPHHREAVIFAKKCGGCHTIGEGDRTGPDLLGVTKRRDTKWIAAFIRTPGAVIDSGDAVAAELLAKFKNQRMPDQTLSDQDLFGLIDYLSDCGQKGGCKLALGPIKHVREAKPVDVEMGRQLFLGKRRLGAGGPACVSCHSAGAAGRLALGGGTLALDLTDAYPRLGDLGLHSSISNTPGPVMAQIFPALPIAEAEVFQLKAFLASVAAAGPAPPPDRNFVYVAFLGSLFGLGLAGAIWKDHIRGVRAGLIARSRRNGRAKGHA